MSSAIGFSYKREKTQSPLRFSMTREMANSSQSDSNATRCGILEFIPL